LQQFSDFTGVDEYRNLMGIISYFRDDPIFSSSKWASYSDAGVLYVIANGYNIYTEGENASGCAGACHEASMNWTAFFGSYKSGDETERARAHSLWGTAEQSGVNYGTAIAKSLRNNGEAWERRKIDTFVWWGNAYRTIVTNEWDQGNLFDWGLTDPASNASYGFVYTWSQTVINGIAGFTYVTFCFAQQEVRQTGGEIN
jgi:hypothetical protein